jgi:hypothetical protein
MRTRLFAGPQLGSGLGDPVEAKLCGALIQQLLEESAAVGDDGGGEYMWPPGLDVKPGASGARSG